MLFASSFAPPPPQLRGLLLLNSCATLAQLLLLLNSCASRDDEIEFHTQAGLSHGLTREETEEIFVQLTIYAGIPRAVGGVQAARRALAKADERAARL